MECSLPAPTAFNIDATNLYSEWKHWSSAFEIYSIASDLKEKEDAAQRATMLHCLGPAVQRIFNTLPGEHKSLEEAKTALNGYFAPKRNVVAERYKFRSRAQRVCRSRSKADQRKGKKGKEKKPPMKVRSLNSKPSTDWLENSSDDESEVPVLSLNNSDSSITARIYEQRIKMIVDTGSKYDIISSELHKTQFKNYELSQTQKRFTAYGQKDPLKCKGYFNTAIRLGDKTVSSKIYVIEGNAESLLGGDSSFKVGILIKFSRSE